MIYLIHLSKGEKIKIDEEDLQHIQDNLSAPLIRVKQAIINPSFMVSITPSENEEDIVTRKKVIVENGVAKIIGEESVKALADKMNILKALK
jgi:hypothetical protein